jgi:hypothetical protein
VTDTIPAPLLSINDNPNTTIRTRLRFFVSGSSFMIRFTLARGICSPTSSVGGGGDGPLAGAPCLLVLLPVPFPTVVAAAAAAAAAAVDGSCGGSAAAGAGAAAVVVLGGLSLLASAVGGAGAGVGAVDDGEPSSAMAVSALRDFETEGRPDLPPGLLRNVKGGGWSVSKGVVCRR